MATTRDRLKKLSDTVFPPKKPKSKLKKKKGVMMFRESQTEAGRRATSRLPLDVQRRLDKATVGEGAEILREQREFRQKYAAKPRKRRGLI